MYLHNALRGIAATVLVAFAASAQTAATVAGGRLTLTTPGTDQNVKIEVNGAVTRLFGFAGIAEGTAYSNLSGVTVNTGAGNDQVAFDIIRAQSFDIRANTGAGESSTQVQWDITPGAAAPAANIVLTGDAANRKVSLEIESLASDAAISINAGTASELNAKVLSPNVSNSLRVAFNATSPKSSFEVASSAAAVELDLRAGANAGMDELVYKLSQSRQANVSVNWGVNTGDASDKVEASISSNGGNITHTGFINTGAGDDFLSMESEAFATVNGLSINAGAGNDEVVKAVKGFFQMSQTLGLTVLGGDGDDKLSVFTDTAIRGSGLPNDVETVINCGAGNDLFRAFGIILGCEARM